MLLPKFLWEDPSHFFQAGGSWVSLGCGSITPVVASNFFWPSSLFFFVCPPSFFLSLIQIVVIIFTVYSNPGQSFFEALMLIISIKIWSPSEVPDDLSFVAGVAGGGKRAQFS